MSRSFQQCRLDQLSMVAAVARGSICWLVLVLGTPSSLYGQTQSADELSTHWTAAQQAIEQGEWQLAADHLQHVSKIVPYEFSSRQLLARCSARLGDTDAALDALQAAIELGWEDEQALLNSDDLAPLRETERFNELMQKLRDFREERFVLVHPKRSDKDQGNQPRQLPVIVFFHGRGESPRGSAPEWQPIVDQLGVCLLLPKGTKARGQVYVWDEDGAKGSEAWKIDRAAAEKVASSALAWLKSEHGIVPQPLILAGFSQGAVVAIKLLAQTEQQQATLSASALLLMGGAFAKDAEYELPDDLKVAQIVGTQDRWQPANLALRDMLQRQQIQLRYHEHAGGHDLPRPFAEFVVPLLRDDLLPKPVKDRPAH